MESIKPIIYFTKESPDFNFLIENPNPKRIAANRCVLCILTEYGICNDKRMNPIQFSNFIQTTQAISIVTE